MQKQTCLLGAGPHAPTAASTQLSLDSLAPVWLQLQRSNARISDQTSGLPSWGLFGPGEIPGRARKARQMIFRPFIGQQNVGQNGRIPQLLYFEGSPPGHHIITYLWLVLKSSKDDEERKSLMKSISRIILSSSSLLLVGAQQ